MKKKTRELPATLRGLIVAMGISTGKHLRRRKKKGKPDGKAG